MSLLVSAGTALEENIFPLGGGWKNQKVRKARKKCANYSQQAWRKTQADRPADQAADLSAIKKTVSSSQAATVCGYLHAVADWPRQKRPASQSGISCLSTDQANHCYRHPREQRMSGLPTDARHSLRIKGGSDPPTLWMISTKLYSAIFWIHLLPSDKNEENENLREKIARLSMCGRLIYFFTTSWVRACFLLVRVPGNATSKRRGVALRIFIAKNWR